MNASDTQTAARPENSLELIAEFHALPDLEQAVARFLDSISLFGFAACAAGAWTGVGATRAYRFYFNSWPAEWNALYAEKALFVDDPIVLETRRRMTPFLLSEEEARMREVPGAGAVIDTCYAFGWRDVFGVPIHGPGGYQALVSFAAFEPVSLDAKDRAALAAMAHAIHDRCHATVGFGSRPAPALSARQIACMRWVAAGKTDDEIAVILGISTATVHYHVERVKKMLDVRTRAEAAALLVLDGIL